MDQSYQLTIEDINRQEIIQSQPKRIAYIDECGSFSFDFATTVHQNTIFCVQL